MNRRDLTLPYMALVIAAGVVCVVWAAIFAPYSKTDVTFLLLAGFTVAVGSRITIPIPQIKSRISVSDIFIFLTLLLYGGEMAIMLSAVEAFCSSIRFCNKRISMFFNGAAMAISTTFAVVMLKVLGLYSESQLHGFNTKVGDFLVALCILAVAHFLANTFICATQDSLINDRSWIDTWTSRYVWVFPTNFLGAAGAGLLVQLSDTIGAGIIIATFPVILFVSLTYKMYLQNIEMSMLQAKQAQDHAEVLKVQSDALRESEERFRAAFHHAPIGIALLSASGKWLRVNKALCAILGYSEEEFLNSDMDLVLFPEDLSSTVVMLWEVVSGNIPSWQEVQRYRHKKGHIVWASWSVSLASHSSPDSYNLILQLQDITDKKLAEDKLQHEATHDSLTGLPNRALFMNKLGEALGRSKKDAANHVGVLFVDIDRFKCVNDSLGHMIGDRLLVKISERLSQCVRPDDLVARLGGDEFTILVEGNYGPKETEAIAERIHERFAIPFLVDGNEIYSSASIGILHASEKHLTPEEIMRDADTAMYHAKRSGKARHQVFDETMHDAAMETLLLETELRHAVEREDFTVEYQPIVSLKSGKIEGVQALPRWEHPRLGSIGRRKFVELAEEIGVIGEFAISFLQKACSEIGQLNRETDSGSSLLLSIHILSSQLIEDGLLDKTKTLLETLHFAPGNLSMEITESVLFEHREQATRTLHQIGQLGIDLQLGHFGTGYSNLMYITKLPLSGLKIDRAFVNTISNNGANGNIVRALTTFAKNLGLKAVAEGVSTTAQIEELRELNCDSAQGPYFGEPMSIGELRRYIAEHEKKDLPGFEFNDLPVLPVVQ